MNKTRMRKAKYLRTKDLEVIRKIHELYTRNLIAYRETLTHGHKKQVIKNCFKIADLVKSIEDPKDDFVSGWIKKETESLEQEMITTHYSFGTIYEGVQVAIHSSMRDIGFGECLDHKINIHYCESCKEKFNVQEQGDLKIE